MDMLQNMMWNAIKNNPQLNNILNEIKTSGKTPEELFREKAKAQGIDPDEFLKTLQSLNK